MLGGTCWLTDVRRLGTAGGELGAEGVVPGAVHRVALKRQGIQALGADRDSRRVVAGVQGSLDTQTAAGAGRRDGLDDHLVAGQWPAPPAHGDVGEQPVLDLVPLGGAWREVADRDRQPCLGCQGGQFALPDAVAVAVGAARVRGDQQARCLRVVPASACPPPAADGLDREDGGVVVDADVDPAAVAGEVVDRVRDGLLDVRTGEEEVVVFDLDGLALGAPLPTSHGQPPQLFALLGIHADHRLAVGLVVLDLLVEVTELGIPVGVLGAFECLGVGLQAEHFPLQQSTHRRGGDRMSLPCELLGQVPQRFGRPPQRRHWIAALVRLHQREQGWEEVGVLLGGCLASPTWPADAAGRERRLAGLQLNHALTDGRLAHASHLRDRAHATVPQQPRLDRQRQALLALVEMRQQDREPRGELTTDLHRYAHARIPHQQAPKTENGTLFPASFTSSATSPTGCPRRWPPPSPSGCAAPTTSPTRWWPRRSWRRSRGSWTAPTPAPLQACARGWPRPSPSAGWAYHPRWLERCGPPTPSSR